MHLVFLPVVHTTDKKGNKIDKLACSEFWKSKDSYRELQNAFYNYMVSHNFNLLRGLPKEETNRQHLDIKEYKELTNFEVAKELVESITYDIPEETNIKDLKKIMFNKNEKILNDIIKPKDDMIKQLYKENKALHKELSRQTNIVDEAERYQIERTAIISDNKVLHNKIDKLECEYKNKSIELELEYENKYEKLENENRKLHNVIDRFYITISKFIKWVCYKFGLGNSNQIIRDFERENNTYIDPYKQIADEQEDEEEM
ncbi:MAG: plasmid recombination protein [Clostridia bacterium]|nr:plasmid recombination protein [Clostridia bacterium]